MDKKNKHSEIDIESVLEGYAEFSKHFKNGDEIPYTITERIPRPGFLGWLARLFHLSFGWTLRTKSGIGVIYDAPWNEPQP